MSTRALRVAALVAVPLLTLVLVDRALVLDRERWEWAAREIPRELLDPYRVEGLLRTLEPGRDRVLLVGNSTANKSFHDDRLVELFSPRGIQFEKATIGGASMVTFGMLAEPLAELRPRAVLLVVQPPAVRAEDFHTSTTFYDWRAVPSLYTRDEFLADPLFHLDGLVRQSTVLARQRSSIQRVFLIRHGLLSFGQLRIEAVRHVLAGMLDGNPWHRWLRRARQLDAYPNPNTRAIRHLAARLEAHGSKLLVVEAPSQSLAELLTGPRRFRHFRERMALDAQEGGYTWIPADDYPDFEDDDFEDMVHLNEVGRLRFTNHMAAALAELL